MEKNDEGFAYIVISPNLWDVVEEGYKEKGRKAKKDRVLDSMALLIILQAVDQSVLRCTVRANTSKEAWNAIQDKYQVKTGPIMTDAAVGRIAQGTKILTEGGYEKVFRQTFETVPEEKLLKAYACYLSTSAGPVMGLLYLSSAKIAFCNDIPLSYKVGEQTQWSYYKVVLPIHQLKAVNPSASKVNPAEKFIQIISVDNYEFWFMGFANYDNAVKSLQGVLRGDS